MERLREISVCILSAVLGYLDPVRGILEACLIIFAVNLLTGITAGILVQQEKFTFRKFFTCVLEATVVCLLIAMILTIGDKLDNHGGAMSAISVVVYALIYFYGVNIFKNLTRLLPDNKLLGFLYYVVSFEVVEKIPYLANYKHQTSDKDKS